MILSMMSLPRRARGPEQGARGGKVAGRTEHRRKRQPRKGERERAAKAPQAAPAPVAESDDDAGVTEEDLRFFEVRVANEWDKHGALHRYIAARAPHRAEWASHLCWTQWTRRSFNRASAVGPTRAPPLPDRYS